MKKQNLFDVGLSNGFALGIACDKSQLQIALIFLVVEFNYTIVIDGLKRFRECLKEN